LSPKRGFHGKILSNIFYQIYAYVCIIYRFTVSWRPPSGPHDRYKLQYQLFSAHPDDWKNIEVSVGSKELECPVRILKIN
jgi:hypothetical protein